MLFRRRVSLPLLLAMLLASGAALCAEPAASAPQATKARLRGALLTAEMATAERLELLAKEGYSAIVLDVGQGDGGTIQAVKAAAKQVTQAGLDLYYWIEVARCEALAKEHPEWMASLQGHQEWRRLHKEFPFPKADEVVKCYPWTPILYRETFDAHLLRIERLLAELPVPQGLFLNDLQGPPTACGCGNPVCRWTADYGPVVTATPLGDDAAGRFVAEVRKRVAKTTSVIPVWTTECEEHDKEKDALCAGVGCFKGICWKAYTKQLMPVADEAPLIGALLLYKEFGQDSPTYAAAAGWVSHAVAGFTQMPAKNGGRAIEAGRLITVLQGYDVTPQEVEAQLARSRDSGAAGYIVALSKLDQSWQPKMHRWRNQPK